MESLRKQIIIGKNLKDFYSFNNIIHDVVFISNVFIVFYINILYVFVSISMSSSPETLS